MEDKIDYIMDRFNFKIVRMVMKFLDWKWCLDEGRVIPEVSEMEDTARDLLEKASKQKERYSISTGGFIASVDGEGELSLSFKLEEVESQ